MQAAKVGLDVVALSPQPRNRSLGWVVRRRGGSDVFLAAIVASTIERMAVGSPSRSESEHAGVV